MRWCLVGVAPGCCRSKVRSCVGVMGLGCAGGRTFAGITKRVLAFGFRDVSVGADKVIVSAGDWIRSCLASTPTRSCPSIWVRSVHGTGTRAHLSSWWLSCSRLPATTRRCCRRRLVRGWVTTRMSTRGRCVMRCVVCRGWRGGSSWGRTGVGWRLIRHRVLVRVLRRRGLERTCKESGRILTRSRHMQSCFRLYVRLYDWYTSRTPGERRTVLERWGHGYQSVDPDR